MPVTATVFVLGCSLLVTGGVPSERVKKAEVEKKLRNVIITSFGELPYDPVTVEPGGFFQADVFPVNLNDADQPQTMDVSLRTRILVEDPKKTKDSVLSTGIMVDDPSDKTETLAEGDVMSTNTKRQVSGSKNSRENEKLVKIEEDEFVSSQVGQKTGYRKPTGRKMLQETSEEILSPPRNFGYEFRQTRKQYKPVPTATDSNDYNINREYYGDLGEGWNLQDADKVLQGRNYNILFQTPNHYPNYYPAPTSREFPPPFFSPNTHHPAFYPFPSFDYKPFLHPDYISHRSPTGYFESGEDYDADIHRQTDSRKETHEGKLLDRHDVPYVQEYQPTREKVVPYSQNVYYGDY